MYDMVCGPVAASWGDVRQVYLGYDQYVFHTKTAAAILNALLTAKSGKGKTYDVSTFRV